MNSSLFDSGCSSVQDWHSLYGIRHRTGSGSDRVHKKKGDSRESKRKLLQKRLVRQKQNGFMQ